MIVPSKSRLSKLLAKIPWGHLREGCFGILAAIAAAIAGALVLWWIQSQSVIKPPVPSLTPTLVSIAALNTPQPIDTPTPQLIDTPTATDAPTATSTPVTPTNTLTYTPALTDTPTLTSTNTSTVTNTFTPTDTPTASDTPTPTFTPTNTPPNTLTFTPTLPTFTWTPSYTPTPTLTFTPAPLIATAISNGNVRGGPGLLYSVEDVLSVGQTIQVCGRNEAADWLRLCDVLDRDLWVAVSVVNIQGDVGELRVYPAPPLFILADFNRCTGDGLCKNSVGGDMGAAYEPPDYAKESYPSVSARNRVARVDYDVTWWGAFWMKLLNTNLSSYCRLAFAARMDPPGNGQLKVEFKPTGMSQPINFYVSGITYDWQTFVVNFSSKAASFARMNELVFTLERNGSRASGVFYIDNVRFWNC